MHSQSLPLQVFAVIKRTENRLKKFAKVGHNAVFALEMRHSNNWCYLQKRKGEGVSALLPAAVKKERLDGGDVFASKCKCLLDEAMSIPDARGRDLVLSALENALALAKYRGTI